MLFRKGIQPSTEFERVPGVRSTKNRRRSEIAVRAKDFERLVVRDPTPSVARMRAAVADVLFVCCAWAGRT